MAEEWCFRISVSKSKYVVFGLKKKLLDKSLSIYNSPLESVKSVFRSLVWGKNDLERTQINSEKVWDGH